MKTIVKKSQDYNSPIVNNIQMVNFTEIARQMGVSGEYVRLLMTGKRKSAKRIEQIRTLLDNNKAA